MAPPTKRQKLSPDVEVDGHNEADDASVSASEHSAGGSSHIGSGGEEASTDTEDEIGHAKHKKSSKTLKRKHRATDTTRFGATLQHLLRTDAPSALPLSLKPSIARRQNEEKLELKGRKVLLVERKEKEEKGRIKDVIGGWGGESERALRKVAQRGVVKLFNVIQQSQAAASTAAESIKAERGTGKPTLPAPQLDRKKGKKSKKDNILGQGGKTATAMLGQSDFLESIRSGGVVSKV
ncbi:Rrp15p-domain-containing protein [Cristinia sonorae]|uniref:Rrp15p-domain-containing protein n=1 Tax=Cristinia sonorae TaxID=1940300 RepID=A0A8K0UR90_9AGAR|nr:Rrp15p-domain-containing protein [Cristinia sonorae]